MQFRDVHVMLRLPVEGEDWEPAGCNFAATNTLLAIVSGLSVLMTPNLSGKGKSEAWFKGALSKYYPWDLQPTEGDTTPHGICGTINHLYTQFRNPLAHSLGLKQEGNYRVQIEKDALSENEIEQIESSASAPGAAVAYHPSSEGQDGPEAIILNVANLYWGVRVMLKRMTEDKQLMQDLGSKLANIQGS